MLKLALGLWLTVPLAAQDAPRSGDPALRTELTRLLQAGTIDQAVRRAQEALQDNPRDAGIRHEYVELHLSLARTWLAERRFDDCLTALEAVLAAKPGHVEALGLRREIVTARERTADRIADVQHLLRLELFDAALERVREIRALRPDLSDELVTSERAAWLGAADDHYLAGNFPEAFALYERLAANGAEDAHDARVRRALSLALALAESGVAQPLDSAAATRLLARATDGSLGADGPRVARVVEGLLAERAGKLLEAGRAYAAALDEPWQLPPADRRAATVERLRTAAIDRVRALYAATPTRRRGGAWLMTLPDVWKQRQTAHFDVYARNDLIAERVADAAEFHLTGIADWLGQDCPPEWQPRCELRVHANAAGLQKATGVQGTIRSLSRTRVQGERVLSRRLDVVQTDPLLLNTALPNELTHLLLTTPHAVGHLPRAIVEGLALQAEPPARRLLMRRNLAQPPPDPTRLLATKSVPEQPLRFYADCDALTGLLLHRLALQPAGNGESSAAARLIDTFRAGLTSEWWRTFGWTDEEALKDAWRAWYAARRNPPRMPLMILGTAPPEPPSNGQP